MITIDGIIYNLQRGGGISVYFNELLDGLSNKNFDFEVLAYKNANAPFSREENKKPLRPFERYRDVKNVNGSVLHSSYYRVSESSKKKNITTVHDFTYEKYVPGAARLVHSWQKRKAVLKSDIVICISQNTANDLLELYGIKENKIRVIYNGASKEYMPVDTPIKNKNKVLFVGSRFGYKNFHLAVKAIALTPSLHLRIVGGGSLTKKEIFLLEQYLPNRYHWVGQLTNADLNIEYNSAYALLYPSSYEGFGIPIVEAMQAGCPVIAVNASSIPEVAGSAAILVDTADVYLLKDALESIAASREKLIAAGIIQAKKFSWAQCVCETINVYNEVL